MTRNQATTEHHGTFPFGEPIRAVAQEDRRPKEAFVLAPRAGTVAAQWLDADGQLVIRSLPVASEPGVLWDGEGTEDILRRIRIPRAAGSLVPTEKRLNGVVGRAFDELILRPLGLDRSRVWLCNLAPFFLPTTDQARILEDRYSPVARRLGLPPLVLPPVARQLADDARREAILDELRQSQASTLITLGDLPLSWFVKHFRPRLTRLADFGTAADDYGQRHPVRLDDVEVDLLPLAHPLQASRRGFSADTWTRRHQTWMKRVSGGR